MQTNVEVSGWFDQVEGAEVTDVYVSDQTSVTKSCVKVMPNQSHFSPSHLSYFNLVSLGVSFH